MYRTSLMALCLIWVPVSAAVADVTEQEAIQAQIGAVLASADYVAENCPFLRIDQQRLASQIRRSGMTESQLRASEEFADQWHVIAETARSRNSAMLCWALSLAHGGYARGVIVKK